MSATQINTHKSLLPHRLVYIVLKGKKSILWNCLRYKLPQIKYFFSNLWRAECLKSANIITMMVKTLYDFVSLKYMCLMPNGKKESFIYLGLNHWMKTLTFKGSHGQHCCLTECVSGVCIAKEKAQWRTVLMQHCAHGGLDVIKTIIMF